MKLSIRKVVDEDHDSERIILDVLQTTNLVHYLISDTTYKSAGKISNKLRHIHWFAPKEVKAGDVVKLYTKKGTDFSSKKEKYTLHICYWGLDSCVWNDEGDRALLMELSDWQTKSVNA